MENHTLESSVFSLRGDGRRRPSDSGVNSLTWGYSGYILDENSEFLSEKDNLMSLCCRCVSDFNAFKLNNCLISSIVHRNQGGEIGSMFCPIFEFKNTVHEYMIHILLTCAIDNKTTCSLAYQLEYAKMSKVPVRVLLLRKYGILET